MGSKQQTECNTGKGDGRRKGKGKGAKEKGGNIREAATSSEPQSKGIGKGEASGSVLEGCLKQLGSVSELAAKLRSLNPSELSAFDVSYRNALLELLPPEGIKFFDEKRRLMGEFSKSKDVLMEYREEIPSLMKAFRVVNKLNSNGMPAPHWEKLLVSESVLPPPADVSDCSPIEQQMMQDYEERRAILQGTQSGRTAFPIFLGGGLDVKAVIRELEPGEEELPTLDPSSGQQHVLPDWDLGSEPFVHSYATFHRNMEAFSQGLLHGLDLGPDRLVVGGSATMACALPVLPAGLPRLLSKIVGKTLSNYICDFIAETPEWLDAERGSFSGSDLDLFVIADTIEEARERFIAASERVYRNMCGLSKRHAPGGHDSSDVNHVLMAKTGNTITFCGWYPLRHVQIVAYAARSIDECLALVDLDCTALVYDGSTVWSSHRAVRAHCTGFNFVPRGWLLHVDSAGCAHLPNRVMKYASRGWGTKLVRCCFQTPRSGIEPSAELQVMMDAIESAQNFPPKLYNLFRQAVSYTNVCIAAQELEAQADGAAKLQNKGFYDTGVIFPGIPRGSVWSPQSVRELLIERRQQDQRMPRLAAVADSPVPLKDFAALKAVANDVVSWRVVKARQAILDPYVSY
mmetsp:Transcript_23809/g.54999  ORF Transcript_23809/g.54999 Transcript_23809/m.54999 type:complete len:630 (-) Transcript_23809:47-1936(-)